MTEADYIADFYEPDHITVEQVGYAVVVTAGLLQRIIIDVEDIG